MHTTSVVVRTPVLFMDCSFVDFMSDLKTVVSLLNNEKKWEKKKKRKKRGLGLSIVWELNLEVLEFGISFMLDFDVFSHCLATYPYVPHLVRNTITTLKIPSDLDLHVFSFFRGALRVNSSLEIWVIQCIFCEVM